jgi:hypothetical protein
VGRAAKRRKRGKDRSVKKSCGRFFPCCVPPPLVEGCVLQSNSEKRQYKKKENEMKTSSRRAAILSSFGFFIFSNLMEIDLVFSYFPIAVSLLLF